MYKVFPDAAIIFRGVALGGLMAFPIAIPCLGLGFTYFSSVYNLGAKCGQPNKPGAIVAKQ